MGYLADKVRQFWTDIKDAVHAVDDLKAAIEAHDIDAARLAISHSHPSERTCEDQIIGLVRDYAKSEAADPAFLRALREAIYENHDQKIHVFETFEDNRTDKNRQSGYAHPNHVYGMAAYLNDVEKLRELGEKGITPDAASNYGSLKESIVMGTARLGAFDAMKEVIRQGASLDRNFGWDDFPPMHAFSKPLFHVFHPGVTEALLETGNERIIQEVRKALRELKPPSANPGGPGLHP